MNGLFWFVVTFCLIALGFLFGWSMSSWAGKDVWTAIGAIGSWFGGFGAVYAAHVALKIANRQADEDTHKLKVNATFSDGLFIVRDFETSRDDFLYKEFRGTLVLQAYNSGRRPIELVRLVYTSEVYSGSIELKDFLIPAGCRRELNIHPSGYVDYGQISRSLSIGFLFACELAVEDAAGGTYNLGCGFFS